MDAIGVVGLGLMGVPVAAALDFISGLLEFVPFFGSIASGYWRFWSLSPRGPEPALYVAIFFIVVQQVEAMSSCRSSSAGRCTCLPC